MLHEELVPMVPNVPHPPQVTPTLGHGSLHHLLAD